MPNEADQTAAERVRHRSPLFLATTLPNAPAPSETADQRRRSQAWIQSLENATSVLNLPPRFAKDGMPPARATFCLPLPSEGFEAIIALCRAMRVKAFEVIFASFCVLLHRYTRQDDFVLGAPAAQIGVGMKGDDQLFALRIGFCPGLSFRDLVSQTMERVHEALALGPLPLDQLTDDMQLARRQGRHPLLRVGVEVRDVDGVARAEGAEATDDHGLDLCLSVSVDPQNPYLRIAYSSDFLDDLVVSRMAGHMLRLLQAAALQPDRPVGELPMITEAERHLLLVAWNATGAPYPLHLGIHQLFETQAQCTPDAVAIEEGDRCLTYRELDAMAEQCAAVLLDAGLSGQGPVAVLAERSAELVAGLLGILKAGGAFLPLDPAYPHARLRFCIADAGARIVLAQHSLRDRVSALDGVVLDLETTVTPSADLPRRFCHAVAEGGDRLAYVIYTSGSTGQPKGVMGTHQGAVNRIFWMLSEFPVELGEACLQKTSIGFVDSIWEIFGPLSGGARLVVVPEDAGVQAGPLAALMIGAKASRLVAVPGLLDALVRARDGREALRSLRVLTTSGEAVSPALWQSLACALNTDAALLNIYGSSEVAADATCFRGRQGEFSRASVPIGRPIANTRIYILDQYMQPAPIGVTGELYVGGTGVAQGYLNRQDLTSERFLPDPFCEDPGARVFRTGDLARYLPDGNIEYFGRLDLQVKIRGVRIELAEIERVLLEHEAVAACVVMAPEQRSGDRRIIGCLVAAAGVLSPTNSELRAHVRRLLPQYMAPSSFFWMESLPRLPNGKLDRKRVPSPRAASGQAAHVPPRTSEEQLLAEIWCSTLGLDRVGVEDDFFELGGHSLMAAEVAARVRDICGEAPPLRLFIEKPTIAALAPHVALPCA